MLVCLMVIHTDQICLDIISIFIKMIHPFSATLVHVLADNIVIFHIFVCVDVAMRSIRYETGTCKLIVVNNEISLTTIS